MRLKVGIWLVIAAVVFAAVLASAPTLLRSAHLHWPAWPIALVGAIVTAVAGLTKPVADVITRGWAQQARGYLDRKVQARELERTVGGRDKGLPLAGGITDRALLGIHPAIPLPAGGDGSLTPDYPLYIPRDLDADLRTWITAHHEVGGFLLLVGPAASGKTRCAYELVHSMLADWPMFMPSTPAQLVSYFDASPSPGKLIVWLNETQKFLGSGGLKVADVRHIRVLPWPVILIGTMWPQRYDSLTNRSERILGDDIEDSREILTVIAERKDLLARFSAAELGRATRLAARDPRIAEALAESGTWNLTETLAAAPDLINRWQNASDPYGAAVITAAVTARRCGHPEPLPADILRRICEIVLTPADCALAAGSWFEQALDWARTPVRGPVAPLTPRGNVPGVIDGDQISDVLVQYAARYENVSGHAISEETWLELIDKATPRACCDIADAAYHQRHVHQTPIAERAIRKAADAGHVRAMFNLGVLLNDQGETDEAERWWRKAADAGNTDAMSNLGLLLNDQGEPDEAEWWCRRAAGAGGTDAMSNLGLLLNDEGETDEAEWWWRKAADAGETGAISNLGALLYERGEVEEAERWCRRAADAGDTVAMSNLAGLLFRRGKVDEAERWCRSAVDAGLTGAMLNLGFLLKDRGETGEAEQWWRKAADAGHTVAMINLSALFRGRGETDQAECWLRKAADTGHTDAT